MYILGSISSNLGILSDSLIELSDKERWDEKDEEHAGVKEDGTV